MWHIIRQEKFWVSWATHPTTISVPANHLYKSYFCLFGQRYDAVYHSPGRYWYAFGRAYHTNFPVSVSYLHKSYSAFHCFWAGILITKRFLVVRLRTDGSLHYINIILIKSTAMNRSVSFCHKTTLLPDLLTEIEQNLRSGYMSLVVVLPIVTLLANIANRRRRVVRLDSFKLGTGVLIFLQRTYLIRRIL